MFDLFRRPAIAHDGGRRLAFDGDEHRAFGYEGAAVRRERPEPHSIKQFSDGFGIQAHPQEASLLQLLPRLAFQEKASWRLDALAR